MKNSLGRTLLFVSDIEENTKEFKKVFAPFFNVVILRTANEAVSYIKNNKDISSVFIDLRSNKNENYNIFKVIKKDESLYFIPTFGIINAGDKDAQKKAFELNALDVITAPLNLGYLLTHISNIIKRSEEIKKVTKKIIKKKTMGLLFEDPLTGLLNLYGFCNLGAKIIKKNQKKSFYLLRWDIIHFKVFNDLFGMRKGNDLLKGIALLLQNKINANEGLYLCGHLSGDHFVTIWDKEKFDANALYKEISKCINDLSNGFDLSIKMGIYEIDSSTDDVLVMTDRALLALNSIKDNYKINYAFFDSSMRTNLIKEETYLSEMKHAIKENQFVVYYQPQVRYDLNDIYGAEALVRWNHPQDGFIPPNEFIPLFEHSGFISELDEYVWNKVAEQIECWLKKGYKVPSISFNVSRIDLKNPNLVTVLNSILKKHNVERHYVRLEITESSYHEDAKNLIKTVNDLKEAGYSVEMDDFGSGYSSLNSLKDVDVDAIKLDLIFLKSVKDNKRSGNIISSVVRLAHTIDIPVIAEGVETIEQAEYLKSIDCLIMQGFLFAKALPANEFEEYIKRSKMLVNEEKRWEYYVDGVNDLLNANTQATLIFNSYVGGAGIIELCSNKDIIALRLNDRFFEVLGAKRGDYHNRQNHIQDGFSAETREIYYQMLQKAIETRKEASCVTCNVGLFLDRNVWVRSTVRCLGKKANNYIFYLSIENVTELLYTNRLFDTIVENIPAGLTVFKVDDNSFKRSFLSVGARQIIGYGKEEVISEDLQKVLQRISEQDRERVAYELINAVKNQRQFNSDMRVSYSDGSVHWVNLNANPISLSEGTVYYGIYTDVTERKNKELAINEENLILKDIVDNLPVCFTTSIKKEVVKLEYISQSFLTLVGYSREEMEILFNNDLNKLIYEGKYPHYENDVEDVDDNNDCITSRLLLHHKNGKSIYIICFTKIKKVKESGFFGYSFLISSANGDFSV